MSSVCPSVCLSVTLVNHDHTHTHTTGFVRDNPGESGAVTRRNIQPLTPIMVINRLLSASSIYYDPWYLPCSVHVPDSLFQQSLQVFFGLPFGLAPSTSYSAYISSPNHCLLFATHAHTIATYFAVVPRLCHLILVSLSTIYLEFCTTHPSNHSHLCPLKCPSFSFLMGQVTLPCNILLCTQLLYNLPWPSYSLVHYLLPFPTTLVLFISTLMPQFSTESIQSLCLLIRSSSVSAITIMSSAYNNSYDKATLNSQDEASMTITNRKGLNAEPWCLATFTSKLLLLP